MKCGILMEKTYWETTCVQIRATCEKKRIIQDLQIGTAKSLSKWPLASSSMASVPVINQKIITGDRSIELKCLPPSAMVSSFSSRC